MEDNNKELSIFREVGEFEDFQKFKLCSRSFDKQYSYIYVARLKVLMDDTINQAKTKWVNREVVKLCEHQDCLRTEDSIVIGVLYKHQELKPSVLKEISDTLQLRPQPARSNYVSSKDMLFLEDEMFRVKLVGHHPNLEEVVTGIVCAILGHPMEDGTFWVEDWCFAGFSQNSLSRSLICNGTPEKKQQIVIISGLDLVNSEDSVSLNLLSEWIIGMVGDIGAQIDEASIIRVIIAGNSVRGTTDTYNHENYLESKASNQKTSMETNLSCHRLDSFLNSIVQCCCVTLMPGEFDPVGYAIPQQAIHPCILPHSARYKSLHGATNPWIGRISYRIVAGSSGQPIKDIMKVAGLKKYSPLIWLEQTLKWRHYAPTAPDTLPTYPYFESDPFVMTDCPDIYFAGNMEEYDTKLSTVDGGQLVRLICVPKFSQTHTAVLVNLQDLHTIPISFGIN